MRARIWTCDNKDCGTEERLPFTAKRPPEGWISIIEHGDEKKGEPDNGRIYCSEACARTRLKDSGDRSDTR